MIPQNSPLPVARPSVAPLLLVADEDPQTLGMMQMAFTAEHFRVITALDGDEVIRRALAERPDLVVMDVRLPKRNGFEVCDYLRHDPEDPQVPIVFVSTAADADVRVEGLARGADDFLSKPFSPRELVGRVRRLLAHASELRAQRRRVLSLDRDLSRSQEETRRVQRDLDRERRLREMAFGFGRDLQSTLDLDEIGERTLGQAMRQLGSSAVALLSPDGAGEERQARLATRVFRGASAMRFAGLSLAVPGELATTLAGMGRPVPMHELERWPELRGELAPFLGAGVALLAPLRGPDGLEGVLVSDERLDGVSWTGEDRLAVGALCDLAATAHLNARRYLEAQDRALELTAARAHVHPNAAKAAAESSRLAERVAQSLELPARERGLLRHAVAFGPWGWGGEGSAKLRAFVQGDSSRRAEMLCSLIERGESLELEAARTVAERQAALIAGVCARHQVGRVSGRSPMESWNTAVAWAGSAMDPALNEAFALALRDVVSPREIHRAA